MKPWRFLDFVRNTVFRRIFIGDYFYKTSKILALCHIPVIIPHNNTVIIRFKPLNVPILKPMFPKGTYRDR